MMTSSAHAVDDEVCDLQDYRPYFPFSTMKAIGRPVYRSQAGRDYACLLDLDPDIVSWQSFTCQIDGKCGQRQLRRHADFLVETSAERIIVEVVASSGTGTARDMDDREWVSEVLTRAGYRFQAVLVADLNPVRIRNARDLIRYARYEAALGDRIRVLAALDEMSSLTLAECVTAVREGRPMETIASLILHGHIYIDIDESPIGPDTIVSRSAK